MMGYYGNNMMANFGIFGLLTWLALMFFLVLGSMYFWKEIKNHK